MFTLTPATTLSGLIAAIASDKAASKKPSGIIITCDEAHDKAMHYEGLLEKAKTLGCSMSEAEAMQEQEANRTIALATLKQTISLKETPQELNARIVAAKNAAKGLKANGRPCSHKRTQREGAGWINQYGVWNPLAKAGNGNYMFICCRCGAEAVVQPLKENTAQANEAQRILNENI